MRYWKRCLQGPLLRTPQPPCSFCATFPMFAFPTVWDPGTGYHYDKPLSHYTGGRTYICNDYIIFQPAMEGLVTSYCFDYFCCLDYCNLGKTHTMVGTPDNPGLIPRCAAELFKVIDSQHAATTDWKYKILFSYLEIYQEKVITFVLAIVQYWHQWKEYICCS